MKLQFLLLIIFFSSIATSLPVYPGPQLHTFDTNRKSENDLYLERWQKNFGNRLNKPTTGLPPTLFTKPTKPNPAAVGAISDILKSANKPAALTMTSQKKDEKTENSPIKPISPSFVSPTSSIPLNPVPVAGPIFMHGALGFLKPKTKPDPIPASPKFVMPPNTMTKADLVNQIVSQISQDCPGCGRDLEMGRGGWKTRFAAWIKELWKKMYEAVHPVKKINRHPELPGIWWVDGEGF